MNNPEQRRILELVASGGLSVDQADAALQRLSAHRGDRPEQREAERQGAATLDALGAFSAKERAVLRDHEIDGEYVVALRAAGLSDLNLRELILLSDYEVDADFVLALREAGFIDVGAPQLVALKSSGVEADDVRAFGAAGIALTIERLIALKEYDVDADYLTGLRAAGFTGLTVTQLLALKQLD